MQCPNCDCEIDEDELEFICPECGEQDCGEGFFECPDCGELWTINWEGDEELIEWECEYCGNEEEPESAEEIIIEKEPDAPTCPECGEEIDGGYCDYCGWPNNQGWIGENY